jgi:hypothetical protein
MLHHILKCCTNYNWQCENCQYSKYGLYHHNLHHQRLGYHLKSAHLVVDESSRVAQVLGLHRLDTVDVQAHVGDLRIEASWGVASDVQFHGHSLGVLPVLRRTRCLVDREQPQALGPGSSERHAAAAEQVRHRELGGPVEVHGEGGREGRHELGAALPQLHGALVLVPRGHHVVVVRQVQCSGRPGLRADVLGFDLDSGIGGALELIEGREAEVHPLGWALRSLGD